MTATTRSAAECALDLNHGTADMPALDGMFVSVVNDSAFRWFSLRIVNDKRTLSFAGVRIRAARPAGHKSAFWEIRNDKR